MTVPNLHHPVPIIAEPLDRGATFYDENMREEIQIVGYSAQVNMVAQVEYREFASFGLTAQKDRAGLMENEAGYLLVRTIDLAEKSWTPKQYDRIVSIAGGEVDVFITRIKPTAHYHGAPTLYKLYFEDRKPARGG